MGPGQSPPSLLSPVITLSNVACARGDRLVFRALNISLSRGETLIVTGPNGVGKSSLLRLIAGLLPLRGGTIERTAAIALADDSLALDQDLSLRQALAFWAELDRRPAAVVDSAVAALGMTRLANVPVRILSTGQKKRAGIVRVIASGAPIWLLDEPANGLDGEGIGLLEKAIALHCRNGGAVMIASHLPISVEGARTLVMRSDPVTDMYL